MTQGDLTQEDAAIPTLPPRADAPPVAEPALPTQEVAAPPESTRPTPPPAPDERTPESEVPDAAPIPTDLDARGRLGAAWVGVASLGTMALAQAAVVVLTAFLAAPVIFVVMQAAGEANPLFHLPYAWIVVPTQLMLMTTAVSLAGFGVPVLAWALNRFVGGRRMALVPALAWFMVPSCAGLVVAGGVGVVGMLVALGVTQLGALVTASYLEEARGLTPLDAERTANVHFAPGYFFASAFLTQGLMVAVALLGNAVGAAALTVRAAHTGRAVNVDEDGWAPDVLGVPGEPR